MATSATPDSGDIYATFKQDVNMTAAELEKWLKTDESKSVGQDSGDGTSIGRHSGERIIEILHKKSSTLRPPTKPTCTKCIAMWLATRPKALTTKKMWRLRPGATPS